MKIFFRNFSEPEWKFTLTWRRKLRLSQIPIPIVEVLVKTKIPCSTDPRIQAQIPDPQNHKTKLNVNLHSSLPC